MHNATKICRHQEWHRFLLCMTLSVIVRLSSILWEERFLVCAVLFQKASFFFIPASVYSVCMKLLDLPHVDWTTIPCAVGAERLLRNSQLWLCSSLFVHPSVREIGFEHWISDIELEMKLTNVSKCHLTCNVACVRTNESLSKQLGLKNAKIWGKVLLMKLHAHLKSNTCHVSSKCTREIFRLSLFSLFMLNRQCERGLLGSRFSVSSFRFRGNERLMNLDRKRSSGCSASNKYWSNH